MRPSLSDLLSPHTQVGVFVLHSLTKMPFDLPLEHLYTSHGRNIVSSVSDPSDSDPVSLKSMPTINGFSLQLKKIVKGRIGQLFRSRVDDKFLVFGYTEAGYDCFT